MKIVFPHMGQMASAFMGCLRNLGVETVIPSRATNRSLALGVPHSPEFACLPFKMTLGNFIEALEHGADTIVMIGGRGPCRLGYYSVVQEQILRSLGYDFQIIRTDNPDALRSILHTMTAVSGVRSPAKLLANFYFIMQRLVASDEISARANWARAMAEDPSVVDEMADSLAVDLDATRNLRQVWTFIRHMRRRFALVKLGPAQRPLRIGLVGEIFMVLEPFANMDIERRLGRMGALVHRGVSLADWFNERIHFAPWRPNLTKRAARLARNYLGANAGGESILSVGRAVEYARSGYDGMIHVMPFGCMPEMVAQSVMSAVTRDTNLPILSLQFDEHVSEVGVVTRLEAFVDMLEHRRHHKQRSSGPRQATALQAAPLQSQSAARPSPAAHSPVTTIAPRS